MEISKVSDETVKIKGKNATVLVDPKSKGEAEIVIALDAQDSLALDKVGDIRLVISGPGEYEAGGISVTGKQRKNGITYHIFDSLNIMLTTSSAVVDVPDDEGYDCVLIKVISPIKEDDWGPVNAKCVVLYGDLSLVSVKSENQEKTTRVNLKKTAEITGKTFIL